MPGARVGSNGGEDCCTVDHRASGAHGKSESTSDTVAGRLASVGFHAPAVHGTEETSRSSKMPISCSHNPRSLTSDFGPLLEHTPHLIDDDPTEPRSAEFCLPPAAAARPRESFARQLGEQDRRVKLKDPTACVPVAQSWHSVSEVNLDQIILDSIDEYRSQRNQNQRQDTLFAPNSPNLPEPSTRPGGLASPFCRPDSKTVWKLNHPNRQEYQRMKQDWQKLEWDDEMCGYRRILAASWALTSVVAWGPEGLLRLGGQTAEHEQNGASLQDRAVSWMRSLMECVV
ncbi:uncharacterized protein Z520_12036 [Fonsecaea multimorphosa CBS 102226]|uniref:Uncharacterized protein n=1 Tax=Fonsecaea multimorphosa CBS 102226 TaxID=1442371 RepID=A0A0D2GRZ7_9EURO|nr:uncharacterized protein Z520_12036 [Fonsecaea multimorphosa CBS 102226]KIX92290.1 hypothetical protein Z520_12036 [Fonsecaea multimorphosa CBS 102226]OAL17660.1 hypothetical protein AYO22_11450 [Fonsecaea multimorphosa]